MLLAGVGAIFESDIDELFSATTIFVSISQF